MNISKTIHTDFSAEPLTEYILKNDNNMSVHILSYGATIYKIYVPDKNNQPQNVVLSFLDINNYYKNTLLTGSCLGPNAGRLENALLPVKDHIYTLSKNEGKHQIHGGFSNISYAFWKEESFCCFEDKISLTLSCFLPDQTDGYPGNRTFYATYELLNDNTLSLTLKCTTDACTYVNLSNHAYFNLSGNFQTSALLSHMQIQSENYLKINDEHISKEICPVLDTPFDYRTPRRISYVLSSYENNLQTTIGKGYNHAFSLDNTNVNGKDLQKMYQLTLWDETSNRRLRICTDAPCIVVYSGGFIGNDLAIDNSISSKSCAIAFEAQDYPNAPIFGDFPSKLTDPLHPLERKISFSFDCTDTI